MLLLFLWHLKRTLTGLKRHERQAAPRNDANYKTMKRLEKLRKPPREVPLTISLKALLGGVLQQMGWGFFSFGMVFFLVFAVSGGVFEEVQRDLAFRGDRAKASGKVVSVAETSIDVNEQDVVEFEVEYKVNGETFRNICYKTGWKHDEGAKVQVEYLSSDPSLGRIVDSRWAVTPWWLALLILIFPGVGLLMLLGGVKSGLANKKLLKFGHVAYGELVSKDATNTRINDRTVYELSFKFRADSSGRDHIAKTKTHETEKLEDEEQEPLLYLASCPDEAILFDNLPGAPGVNARGQLVDSSPLGVIAYLFLPILGLSCLAYSVQHLLDSLG